MVVKSIYSNNLNPAQPNITERFTNAVGFFINAPLLDAELEIDCFLQVYLPFTAGEQVRNYPLGKITEQAILLNLTDTESLVSIPEEFLDTDLEMSLLFLASDTTFLEVYVIEKKYNLADDLTLIKDQLSTIQLQENVLEAISNLLLQLSQLDTGIFTIFEALTLLIPESETPQLESNLRTRLDLQEEFL